MRYILLILLLSVGLVPNLYAADVYSTQYLYISFVITIYFFWSLKQDDFINPFSNKNLRNYILFFLLSGLSLIIASNKTESLIILSRLLIWILTGITFINLIKGEKKYVVFCLYYISALCIIEALAIFYGFISNFQIGIEFGRSSVNKGFASNINIAAFSLINKIPFLVYTIEQLTRNNKKYYLILPFLVISFFSIAITGSRGALLTSYVILFFSLVLILYSYIKKAKFLPQIKRFFLIYLFSFMISSALTELVFDSLSVSYRTEQIIRRGSQSRLRYYFQAFNSFKENIFTGIGIGNWKIESVKMDKDNIEGYIVPYHAHNDFLQIAAETGIFGIAAYVTFFISFFIFLIKKILKSGFDEKLHYPILLFLISYIMDSSLNFPIVRPINTLILFAGIGLVHNNFSSKKKKNYVYYSLPIFIFFVTISSYSVYKSHTEQIDLLYDFNNNTTLKMPIETVDKFNIKYPNISATALPLGAMIARYHFESKNYEKAKNLLLKTKKYNPYIQINNHYLGRVYESLEEKDSAAYYYRIAHEGLKLNSLHAYHYMRILSYDNKNESEIDKIFETVKSNNEYLIWNEYVNFKTNVYLENPKSSNINKLFGLIDKAKSMFVDKELEFERFKMIIKYGSEKVLSAKEIIEKGINYLDSNNYSEAKKQFLKARQLLPQEYASYENLAYVSLKMEKPKKAQEYLNEEEKYSDFIPNTGNFEYLKGLTFYALQNKIDACNYFKLAIKKGKKEAKVFKPICNF